MKKYLLNSLAFKITLTVIGALFYASIFAQDVSDVRFRQDGNEVIIDYSLDKKSTISVFVSTNGGRTFGDALEKVKGDVGNNVSAGDNRIIWSPLAERGGIRGDDIAFRVVATSKNERFTEKIIFNNFIGAYTEFLVDRYSYGYRYGGYQPPGFSFGVNVGSVKNIGWYADTFLYTSGGVSFSGGPVFRMTQNSALSVGLGAAFGYFGGGVNASVGYNWFIKNFSLMAKVTTVNFLSVGFQLGVGWCLRR